ncbi:MAG: thiamine-monophosphate kinase [Thermomicrobiales bacterium]|nr:thiamine-monophosphate kinase [Thermomicrobiales bacterium]
MKGLMNNGQMTDDRRVREVGEFGLIELLAEGLPAEVRAASDLQLGIGDDAAVWQPTPGELIVVTTDSLVESVHFRRDWTDWESLGHKALAVNVSDLAAMGAIPKLAVISLGLDGEERIGDLQALYSGLGGLARRLHMTIAGGDIVRSPRGLILHVTAIGETSGQRVLTRSGANSGDLIGVTGTLGASAAGLHLLGLETDDARRRAATANLLIEAHLRPEPRVALGAALLELGATSAMDLSDGLLGDLPKILAASGVGARLDEESIPVAAAVRALYPDEWVDLALRGGEDYELLFTAPRRAWDAIDRAAREAGGTVTAIGEVVERGPVPTNIELVGRDGARRTVVAGAYDHFDHA